MTGPSRASILVDLDEAARFVPPMWPLSTFVAVNPLWDLRQLGFDGAIEAAGTLYGADLLPPPTPTGDPVPPGRSDTTPDGSPAADRASAAVDDVLTRWCAAFVGGQLGAGDGGGFYSAWRAGIGHDPAARRLAGPRGRAAMAAAPADAVAAIAVALVELSVGEGGRTPAFAARLARTPGWAGLAKWRAQWAPPGTGAPHLTLVDLMAVRLTVEAALHAEGFGDAGTLPPLVRAPGGRDADREEERAELTVGEDRFRHWLLTALDHPSDDRPAGPPDAQVVFCIDVRSEGMRRHLEAAGPYETLGFAGFFGLPARFRPLGAQGTVDLCPVLVRPTVDLIEVPAGGEEAPAARALGALAARGAAAAAFETGREHPVGSFLLAELTGPVLGAAALARTVAPSWTGRLRSWARQRFTSPGLTEVVPEAGDRGMSLDEQVHYAASALSTMGLVRGFAPLVVLTGHGATSANNPHASALDCGACGGNRGVVSARAAAGIFNRDEVRAALAAQGIVIPPSTWFVAGEHDTVTDRVEVLDRHLVPASHLAGLEALERAIADARVALVAERSADLPGAAGARGPDGVDARAVDWAQVRPEWGLAGNAAIIVGPRRMTAGVTLGRRCFLHSYDAATDPDGTALETILTAPVVVAHWINAQYYFSTVAPELFGAGDKTVHNVVGGIGVVTGTGGDLRIGLPRQSVFDGARSVHEPLRLQVVVEAPVAMVDRTIRRNPVLGDLFDGDWVHLVARDAPGSPWSRRLPGGRWIVWERSNTEEVGAVHA
ncbi:MAG: DUF2309 domain-containing protein [Actinomycetota bacterium]|nr:DUF2309 domain-containing protein [Actinomycetota bacterium]